MKPFYLSLFRAFAVMGGLAGAGLAVAHETGYHHVHFYDSFLQHLPSLGFFVALLVAGYWVWNKGRR
jgi:hypothetical protein